MALYANFIPSLRPSLVSSRIHPLFLLLFLLPLLLLLPFTLRPPRHCLRLNRAAHVDRLFRCGGQQDRNASGAAAELFCARPCLHNADYLLGIA